MKPCGSIRLRARKKENIMVVLVDVLVEQAQVVPVENKGENGAASEWIIIHQP